MSSSNLIDGNDYFQGNAAELFPGHLLSNNLGFTSYPTEDSRERDLKLTPGVVLKGFTYKSASEISLHVKTKQSRAKGKCIKNQKEIKNQIEEEGIKYPIFVTKDPVSGKFWLEHGHHRFFACKELGKTIPCWIIEFDDNLHPEGLNARHEFNQFHNKKLARKAHELDDALRYLNDVKTLPNYFTKQFEIEDEEERTKALRGRANDLLKPNYSAYSPQKRGSIVSKFLKGIVTTKIDNDGASDVEDKFTRNSWSSVPVGSYDYASNTLSYVMQMGREGNYVGLAEDKLRKELGKALRQQGNREKNTLFSSLTVQQIVNHFKKAELEVIGYTTSAKDEKTLENLRLTLLNNLKSINLDDVFSPNTLVAKVLFTPQLLSPIEEKVPVIYEWDKTLKEFVKK